MFRRQLNASQIGFARQGSMDLVVSPCALSKGISRNNSFSRRPPAGHSILQQSRSRASLLVACNANNGLNGDGSGSDVNNPKERQSLGYGDPSAQSRSPRQPQARAGNGSSKRGALDATPDAQQPPSSSASSSGSTLRPLKSEQSWDFTSEPCVPSPANLPTNEGDEPLLYPPRPLWTWTSQPGMDLFHAGPRIWSRLRQVYVILFGVGERETEGIYSLRAFSTDGTPHETIIAFECEEEAQRYAGLLEASMDHKPHVCCIPPLELVSFCMDQHYACRLEPKGSLLIPPDFNVAITDWERSLRLRDGKFAVLDVEPDARGGGGGGAPATATATATAPAPAAPAGGGAAGRGNSSNPLQPNSHHHHQSKYSNLQEVGSGADPSMLARYSGLSAEELEAIRARLEALLPDS